MLTKVQQSVDDVIIISRGRLAHASSLSDLRELAQPVVTLKSPDPAGLQRLLAGTQWENSTDAALSETTAHLLGVSATDVGTQAFAAGLEVHELSTSGGDLESLFLRLVAEQGHPATPESSADKGQVA